MQSLRETKQSTLPMWNTSPKCTVEKKGKLKRDCNLGGVKGFSQGSIISLDAESLTLSLLKLLLVSLYWIDQLPHLGSGRIQTCL